MEQTQAEHTERYLTVPELAELLRIKERKVYDLASSGTVPCSKVTGKLLFPETEVRRWLARGQTGAAEPEPRRPGVFLGSHDPLLDWALRQSRSGIATYFDGSNDGLDRFAEGKGIATGLHLYEAASGAWNTPWMAERFDGQSCVLLGFATRWRGLVIRSEDQTRIKTIEDIAGARFTPRPDGTGTQVLFDVLVEKSRLVSDDIQFTAEAHSEIDAVMEVATDQSDATFGIEALALQHRLAFVPLLEERFDILVDRRAYFEPSLQTFFAFLRSSRFHDQAIAMGGYNTEDAGSVRWIG